MHLVIPFIYMSMTSFIAGALVRDKKSLFKIFGQVAVPIFEGVETKFGLVLPKFAPGIVTVPAPVAAAVATAST
jgi:hypothetical protein